MDINVLISNPDYFNDLLEFPRIDGIYVEQERLRPDKIKSMVAAAHAKGKSLYIALPYVWNEEAERTLNREIAAIIGALPDGYLVRNLDELGLLSDRNVRGLKILDAGLYSWNSSSIKTLSALGGDILTAPYELNKHELLSRGLGGTEVVIYGYYPMMISSNCLRLTTGKCAKEKDPYGIYKLKDRTGAIFSAENRCRYCYNVIYNSVPTWLMDEREVYGGKSVRLSFTTESRLEMKAILSRFFDGDTKPRGSFTRGHYNRGAE